MADEAKTLTLREIVKDAALLREKRGEMETLRGDHTREWALNREFYKNNQWVFWNDRAVPGRVESLGVDDTDKPRYKVRLTANQVTPGVQQFVAQMTKTRPTIKATPNSGADRDVKAAEVAEAAYDHWWREFSLKSKLNSALTHAQISQGYWLITWDPLAGKPFRVMLNPETGEPITDDRLADAFREELAQMNVPVEMFEKTIHMGDIRVQVLSGEQVWVDPIPGNFEDAGYAVCRLPMSVDEVEARYGKKVQPSSTTAESRPALMYTRGRDDTQRPKNVRDVYIGYFKPSPSLPKGRYVVWIEDPDEILFQGNWEFPTNDLPLVKFPGIENDRGNLDHARTTLVRPLQKELNNTISHIAMHKNLTMKPQMIAPVGSLKQRLTGEPGAVFEYAPVQGMGPEWRPIPNIPAYVFEYLGDIQRRIDRIFNLMPSERSQLPPRTDSGELLDLMQEAVADQISPEIQRMEEGLARAGTLMAALAKKFYIEQRLLKIVGAGGSVKVRKFRNSDLEGGFTFHAEAGSGLPRTRAGQTKQIKELVEMGAMTVQDALPYLPVAGLKAIQAKMQADEEFAHRKIDKLLKGEPLNVAGVIAAIQHVEATNMNPMTGEMFQSPEEAMAYIEQVALSPLPFENLHTSMAVLRQHLTSVEFENYNPEIQQRFLSHFEMLQQTLQSQPQMTEPIKGTLSLKGTVGPTVAAEILRQKGIQSATPETMAEPPLETSVYDSVDKPDMDSAGNDPFTAQEQMMAMEREEEAHQLKTAKAMADVALAEKRVSQSDFRPRPASGSSGG